MEGKEKKATAPKATTSKKAAVAKKAPAAKPAAKKQAAADAKGKPVAKAKGAKAAPKKAPKVTMQQRLRVLFQARPKSFLIGQDLPPKRDLTHFVKWPRYIRIARQKKILQDRLKTPPPINMFRHTLDKATAVALFKVLHKMRPEEKQAAKKRRLEGAKYIAKAIAGKSKGRKQKTKDGKPREMTSEQRRVAMREALKTLAARRPVAVKFGLNHVTTLVEKNKAQLVVIAHDVDPIELVVWLPALCRKKKIPFCIVKSKARLGSLVHKKTCSCLCITKVKKDVQDEFAKVVDAITPQFLENNTLFRTWGEGKFGLKHRQRVAKQLRHVQRAEAGKLALQAAHKS